MPTTQANDIREWAAAQGYEVNERGRVPARVREAYNAAHPSMNGGPDYPPGMDEDDFSDAGAPPADAPDPPEPDTGEAKPKPATGKPAGGRWRFGGGKGKRGTRAKAKAPRVPVEDLLASGWRLASRIAKPIPPLQRTLRVQAPVAGVLLEDSVRGTAVDVLLQPIARLQNQGKSAAALFGPPVIVTAISVHVSRQAMAGEAPNPVFMAAAHEMLREAMMLWAEVAGPRFDQAMAREHDFEEKYGQSVDDQIAFIFSMPANEADPDAVRAEEDAIKRAQGIL